MAPRHPLSNNDVGFSTHPNKRQLHKGIRNSYILRAFTKPPTFLLFAAFQCYSTKHTNMLLLRLFRPHKYLNCFEILLLESRILQCLHGDSPELNFISGYSSWLTRKLSRFDASRHYGTVPRSFMIKLQQRWIIIVTWKTGNRRARRGQTSANGERRSQCVNWQLERFSRLC